MNSWTRRCRGGLAALVALIVVTAAAQPPPAPDRATAERQAAINKLPDSPGTGRFPARKEQVGSLPNHVVYRPADLAALGGTKLGVVAWGNGGKEGLRSCRLAMNGFPYQAHMFEQD